MKALYTARPQKRKELLKHSSPDLIRTLCEISLNVLKGNIPLSGTQYKKLKRQKRILKLLTDKNTSLHRKHQAIVNQRGGFLLPLLGVVAPLIGELVGGLIRK